MVLAEDIVQTYNQKQPKFFVVTMYPKVPRHEQKCPSKHKFYRHNTE